jgi:hypothetical protein
MVSIQAFLIIQAYTDALEIPSLTLTTQNDACQSTQDNILNVTQVYWLNQFPGDKVKSRE